MAIPRPHGRFAAIGLLVVATTITATAIPAAAAPATAQIRLAGTPDAIPGSYIVVLKNTANLQKSAGLTKTYGGRIDQSFGALHTYAATMSEAAAKRLAASPDVAYVEQNQRVSL